MDLIVFELGVTGDFESDDLHVPIVPDFNMKLTNLRPHIYVENFPAGNLFMEVQDSGGKKIKASASRPISGLSSSTYFHGYVKFDFEEVGLKKGFEYRLALKSTGYTFGAGSFVGWVNGFDLGKLTEDYINHFGANAALDTEVWVRRQVQKLANA